MRCDGFPQAWGQYAEQSLFQLINIGAVGIQPMTRLWSAVASSQHPAGMAISMRASDHRLITRTRPAAPLLSDKAPYDFPATLRDMADHVVGSREEGFKERRVVGLVVTRDQVDRRRLAGHCGFDSRPDRPRSFRCWTLSPTLRQCATHPRSRPSIPASHRLAGTVQFRPQFQSSKSPCSRQQAGSRPDQQER